MKATFAALVGFFSEQEHRLLTHHPLATPLSFLAAGWVPVVLIAPADARWMAVAFAVNGVLQIGGSWLLLRQYIGHLFMGGQSFNAVAGRLDNVEESNEEDHRGFVAKLSAVEARQERTARQVKRMLDHPVFQSIRDSEQVEPPEEPR